MNTETGEIKSYDELIKLNAKERTKYVPCNIPLTSKQMNRRPPKVHGYERCPCGSGKLFKNCCKRRHKNEK